MASVVELETRPDVDRVLQESHERPLAILKHSVACGRSAAGREEFFRLESLTEDPLYMVVVQRARDVSNYISEKTGVIHHTPQVLVLYQGEVLYHAHHGRITADAVRRALDDAAAQVSKSL
jgi:bacillithiol system protein YtxJ